MNSNQANVQYVDEEINLKELILSLWKRKIMIISITMVFAILAGVISMFFISPVYNTKLNIIISMPDKYETRYGEYQLPLTTNEQYIQLFSSNDVLIKTIQELNLADETNVDNLRDNISIINSSNNAQTSNSFVITVSANNAADSLKLAETLYSNYIRFLDIMIKEQIVNYFYNNYTVELITLENSLKKEQQLLKSNEELLSQTTMELETNNSGIEILEQLGVASNYIVPVNSINPNYIKIETDIISNKQTINSLVNSIDMNKKYIEELGKDKLAIEKFYETGKVDSLEISLISIIDSNVYMPSLPIEPSNKTSPSTVKNIAIGTILGGMLSVMVALFQWYWNKEK